MIRNIFIVVSLIFITILLKSCANIRPPQGGPKDTISPDIIRSFPKNESRQFKSNTLTFEFTEDIKENNFQEELIISPTIKTDYTYKVRGRKLTIDFDKNPWQDSTTYTINFRNGIQDLNENNPLKSPVIAFSTGPMLDTLSISGKITDLLTNTPANKISIALYQSGDTSDISNSKPLYFTKTSTDSYIIRNIKKGKYDIYALEDISNNLQYDSKERIGFQQNITIDSIIKNFDIYITKLDTVAPEIISTAPINEYETVIRIKEGLKSQRIDYQIDTTKYISYLLENQAKNIKIFNTWNIVNDSIPIHLILEDSAGNIGKGNLRIFFEKNKKKDEEKTSLSIFTEPENRKLNPNKNIIKLNFNNPVETVDLQNFKLKEDSIIKPFDKTNFKLNKQRLQADIMLNYPPGKDSLFLIIPDSTIKDYRNNYNKGLKEKFSVKKEEDYAILSGAIKTEAKNYFFELLDDKYNPILTLKNPKKYELNFLTPGSYYIRILVDENNNGKWDNADFAKKTQAEPVIFYKDKINLRANWEIKDINIEF